MTTLETTQTVPLTMIEGGTIRITGTRIPLEIVVYHYQQGESPEDIQDMFPTLQLADIYTVISYYLNHRAEVEEYIRQQEIRAAEMRRMIEASPYAVDTTGFREKLKARWEILQKARDNRPLDCC
jgi:uncharacterized protein (DUF433 family)